MNGGLVLRAVLPAVKAERNAHAAGAGLSRNDPFYFCYIFIDILISIGTVGKTNLL